MQDKRILITGVAGSIGSELARQLCKNNQVYGLDNNETGLMDLIEEIGITGRVGDIRDIRVVEGVYLSFRPQVVFHAAAYKHVAPMEHAPREAVRTNLLGLLNVFAFADNVEKFVFISSDKAVNPDSVMGTTKKLGEIITRNMNQISVRFGNVLGSRGSVIPIWQKQIDQNRPLTVTDERMERYFMTIEEACELVIKAAEIGQGGEIFVLDMGQPIKVLDLAKQILAQSRKDLPIEMIGIKPGEKLREVIMTEAEEKIAIKQDKFFIIKQHT